MNSPPTCYSNVTAPVFNHYNLRLIFCLLPVKVSRKFRRLFTQEFVRKAGAQDK